MEKSRSNRLSKIICSKECFVLSIYQYVMTKKKIPITVMYMGKDKDGRYNFIDTGRFIMSKEFIENKSISIDKSFDEDKAFWDIL